MAGFLPNISGIYRTQYADDNFKISDFQPTLNDFARPSNFESPVADPGFSRGGTPTPKLGLFCKLFAEKCMKMKEFGPLGVRVPGIPPWIRQWSPM